MVLTALHRLGSIFLLLMLIGCASTPPAPPPLRLDSLLRDEVFGARPPEVDPSQVFALNDAMRRYLREDMAGILRRQGPVQGLLDALYDSTRLRLEYDAQRTRNAAEAFAARQGNCMALVVMTGAMAKELGIDVTYQKVITDTEWQRIGDLFVSAGHINLRLEAPLGVMDRVAIRTDHGLVVDFQPGVNLRSQLVTPVSEATVIAMFMNNRAAESISAGQLDAAYWWAREAVLQDSRYVAAYNTLAVIYKRKGLLSEAISLLGFAHDAAPKDPVVLANLADFLRDGGRGPEATIIEAKLKAIEPYPPYYFFQRALAALKNSDFATARELFGKDLARQPYNAEFHFGMATTYIAEGDWRHAREHLDHAREYGTTADSRAIYSAKLESLDRQLKKINCRRPSCDQSG